MKRPEQWDSWTGGLEITEMCAAVHAVTTGAADYNDRIPNFIRALVWAFKHWEDSTGWMREYDSLIYLLVGRVLGDWELHAYEWMKNKVKNGTLS